MEWILRSPQIHSTFGNLGFAQGDGYHINESCNAALETILNKILTEDKYLRTYRRSISFGQNIQKDIIPLLSNTKDEKTVELLIRILVNLTIPIECLLSVDTIARTDFGRHTIFEINNLLASTKDAFTDHKVTKVIIDFLKKNIDLEQSTKLTEEQCTNIGNGLLLLRNILHIPEEVSTSTPNHTVQNKILWNMFSQSIDKVLIKLMTIPDAGNWSVTMVQLIALLYKDQHVVTLHKLLNMWLEASLSESSEDNESNTSPPDRGSEDSSPMVTSDPTSDSSDNGGGGKSNCNPDVEIWRVPLPVDIDKLTQEFKDSPMTIAPPDVKEPSPEPVTIKPTEESSASKRKLDEPKPTTVLDDGQSESSSQNKFSGPESKTGVCETSDCGYGTQIENQGSVSTSSNEDEPRKPVHQKPHNPKQKPNTKVRISNSLQYRKRKKIVKRAKANIINVQDLIRKTPTDDDISNVLKEFTVDFLLKGYNSLVRTLHNQILTNIQLEIDTSHFFWLVTYFLKFATQIDLDLEHVCCVLSFDIIAYLTAEGVNLCEQFELAIKLDGQDLKPSIRRLHLVVTAIREFVQAIEVYKKLPLHSNEHIETLNNLQIKMCEMEELKSLMVLLLRHYNPKYHNKQYLQDLIVTNHILLLFVDSVTKLPNYSGGAYLIEHIKQFATPEMMYQYGLLLEDYTVNGEFVNDCIFTLMHHVGGELGCLISLFQPNILKTFTAIWKTEFEICDDWSDLIEYVINTFIKKPQALHSSTSCRLETESFDDEKFDLKSSTAAANEDIHKLDENDIADSIDYNCESWTASEVSKLEWNYLQSSSSLDVVGEIVKLFNEDGITKTRDSVVNELYKQNIIIKEDQNRLLKGESDRSTKQGMPTKEGRDEDIAKLCEGLTQDGKLKFLEWMQKALLDTCYSKIYLEKKAIETAKQSQRPVDSNTFNFEVPKKKQDELPTISPVSYHNLLLNKSVPLVPWNFEQASICRDLKFLQLLHKLGFHMPVDTGKVFIRIPHFWTTDFLYEVAGKILPIDTSKLKFSINDIWNTETMSSPLNSFSMSPDMITNEIELIPTPEHLYQIHKQNQLGTINFTPRPGIIDEMVGTSSDPHNRNWLDIVQRSQELKISLSGKNKEPCTEVKVHDIVTASYSTSTLDVPVLDQHSDMLCDYEDNNSECETASVASNLTRMYVSDEDEKSEDPIGPLDVPPMSSNDSDCCKAGKRARTLSPMTY